MAKNLKSITGIEHIAYSGIIRAMNQGCTGGSGLFDAIFLPFGKVGGLQILRCQGLAG